MKKLFRWKVKITFRNVSWIWDFCPEQKKEALAFADSALLFGARFTKDNITYIYPREAIGEIRIFKNEEK